MDEIDVGLVRLARGADVGRVRRELKALLGKDVDVLTRGELVEREKDFWRENTPIGYVFGFGMFMGFLVGLVICYQILSGDIRDNLQAYATLRAIGYRNRYLAWVVLEESLLLAGLGFFPGLLISAGLYWWLADLTGLPLRMTPGRVGVILLLTAVMCVGSGMLAVRQAQEADPADVF
jgi:putative ABC transport system permease protein